MLKNTQFVVPRILIMFRDRKLLVTGGTGTFGKSFVRLTLEKFNPKKIIISMNITSK